MVLRFIFCLVYVVSVLPCRSQLDGDWSGTTGTDVQLGYIAINRSELFSGIGAVESGMKPMISIGSSYKTACTGDLGFLFGILLFTKDFSWHFNYVLPETVQMQANKEMKMSGYNSSINFGFDLFRKNKWIDVIFYHGIAFGRMKIKYKDNQVNGKYKNPFFALNVMAEPKVNFYRGDKRLFSIGCRGGYYLDLTKTKWKRKDDALMELPGTKLNAWYAQALVTLPF